MGLCSVLTRKFGTGKLTRERAPTFHGCADSETLPLATSTKSHVHPQVHLLCKSLKLLGEGEKPLPWILNWNSMEICKRSRPHFGCHRRREGQKSGEKPAQGPGSQHLRLRIASENSNVYSGCFHNCYYWKQPGGPSVRKWTNCGGVPLTSTLLDNIKEWKESCWTHHCANDHWE